MGVARTATGASPVEASPQASTDSRWAGVGFARAGAADSEQHGHEATAAAVAGRSAKLVIVFASVDHDLDRLVSGVRAAAGGAPVVGCTTAGEISHLGTGDGGVVVAALGGDGFEIQTAIGRAARDHARNAGAAAASAIPELGSSRPHQALLLLSDGVAGKQQEMIRGVHDIVGSGVPLVGGCAGDDTKMVQTFQIHGDEVISGGVVAAAIASEAPIGIGWGHGWERIGEPMLVTRANGNQVDEINDRPALDEYLARLGAPDEVREDAQAFTRWAMTRPLGLGQRSNGAEPVRCVSKANFSQRSIVCTAEVPSGGLAWFMQGDSGSVLRSTAAATEAAVAALDGDSPLAVIAFDCIGRRGVLGEQNLEAAVAQIRAASGGAPVAGLYTYGEIARTRGVNALHSQTFVAMAIG